MLQGVRRGALPRIPNLPGAAHICRQLGQQLGGLGVAVGLAVQLNGSQRLAAVQQVLGIPGQRRGAGEPADNQRRGAGEPADIQRTWRV